MPVADRILSKDIQRKIVDLARSIDIARHSFEGFMDWIVTQRHALGMPISLKALGVQKADIPKLARTALADGNMATNPIPMTEAKMAKLLHKAMSGRL